MNKKMAFEFFGVKQKNNIWSWSGINYDKSLVVMTIWTDQRVFIQENDTYIWSLYNRNNQIWKDKAGNKERIQNIKFSYENLNAKFRAIFITPKHKNNTNITREIIAGEIAPCTSHMFKFVDFNEETGECIAVGYRDVYRAE